MEKEKPKSFRLSSDTMFKNTAFGDMSKKDWWKLKGMSRAEYRNTAIACLLIGLFIPILFWVGILAGGIWIYKVVRKQD